MPEKPHEPLAPPAPKDGAGESQPNLPRSTSPKIPESPAPAPVPTCGFCGTSPAQICSAPFNLGLMLTLVLYCGTCGAILSLQVMGAQPQPQPLLH
jgi:hypothetical protein